MLDRIVLKGFKSIREMDLRLGRLNVLIGANGAGKSNLVSFFRMLHEMASGRLRNYVAETGRAHSLLHLGPEVTQVIEAHLDFATDTHVHTYHARLSHTSEDSLMFANEALGRRGLESGSAEETLDLGAGHDETRLTKGRPDMWLRAAVDLVPEMLRCRAYHFHSTSAKSAMKQYGYIGDARGLRHDGGNLAAVLYRLREAEPEAYDRIVRTIRLVIPFFEHFDLTPTGPEGRENILNWRQRGSDFVLGPHQFSDGTLRAICLITLLLQSDEIPARTIVVDEPELGLHPYALSVIASLLREASHRAQIIVSTQSSTLLDHFAPENVVVVDREGDASVFTRPDPEFLAEWLEDYSLGEVWEKNVVGGGPH